jgi:hypothetical protein
VQIWKLSPFRQTLSPGSTGSLPELAVPMIVDVKLVALADAGSGISSDQRFLGLIVCALPGWRPTGPASRSAIGDCERWSS